MDLSRLLARILGPVLLVLAPTEGFNMGVFSAQTAPVVYLNGTLLFAAGVAILQAHNRWVRDWRTLITLSGWGLAAGGLYRMAAPAAPQAPDGPPTYALLLVLGLVGLALTWKGYGPARR